MSSSSDSLFYTLSNHVQRRIDEAFDVVSKDVGNAAFGADGNLKVVNDVEGAIVQDGDKVPPLQIPLTLIPAALQYLDLPPDDPEICSIFRNAASGWSSSSPNIRRNEEYVSRDDWRAIHYLGLKYQGPVRRTTKKVAPTVNLTMIQQSLQLATSMANTLREKHLVASPAALEKQNYCRPQPRPWTRRNLLLTSGRRAWTLLPYSSRMPPLLNFLRRKL